MCCACGGQRTNCRSQFSLPTMWVLRIELRSPALAARALIHPAVSWTFCCCSLGNPTHIWFSTCGLETSDFLTLTRHLVVQSWYCAFWLILRLKMMALALPPSDAPPEPGWITNTSEGKEKCSGHAGTREELLRILAHFIIHQTYYLFIYLFKGSLKHSPGIHYIEQVGLKYQYLHLQCWD